MTDEKRDQRAINSVTWQALLSDRSWCPYENGEFWHLSGSVGGKPRDASHWNDDARQVEEQVWQSVRCEDLMFFCTTCLSALSTREHVPENVHKEDLS